MTTSCETCTCCKTSWYERNYFLFRRLHSLTGIIPIGVFLIAHLTTNSSILWGKFGLRSEGEAESLVSGGIHYFHKEVGWINEQIPHLLLIEITLWAAIAFHSLLGIVYILSGRPNVSKYPYEGNRRYALQRISGWIGILFVFYHIATLRWGFTALIPGGTRWTSDFAASTLAAALRGGYESFTTAGLVVSAFYMLGASMLVFHFANGLWTSAITWGLTISVKAQQRWGKVCLALGAGLMLAAWGSVIGFAALNPTEAQKTEIRLLEKSGRGEPKGDIDHEPPLNTQNPSSTSKASPM